jgi:hypothetical protein
VSSGFQRGVRRFSGPACTSPGLSPARQMPETFRNNVTEYLSSKVLPAYGTARPEDQHYRNLEELVSYGNSIGQGILGTEGYKYGVAQKLLNLALKYYWCLDVIPEPPHCPIDRIVIDQTRYRGRSWTNINVRREYEQIIQDVRRLAGRRSIAMWELMMYRRR